MIKPSCKDCEKRFLGCHSNCEDYKNFLIEREKRKEMKKQIDRIDYSRRLYFCFK